MNYGTFIDLNGNEIRNGVLQNLASDPASTVNGTMYYNTVSHKPRIVKNGVWTDWEGSAATGDVSHASATSVDNEVVLFSGTGGKTIKRATGSGIPKLTSGVISVATPGTDYSTPGSTDTLTNKTFNANGTGNSISNLETADFAANVIDTDVALAADSDTRLATQKAVKAYVDALLNASDAMVFKGVIDASANPNYPAASAGYTYKISVAGKIGGASGVDVTVGDTIYCITDSTSSGNQATVGTAWVIVQANVDRATSSALGLAEYSTQAEAEAKSDATTAVTPVALVNFGIAKSFLVGNNSATSIACTHNLGTKKVLVSVRKVSTDAPWIVDWVATSTSVVTVTFSVAPTTDEFEVTIIG
jgi:hypothetical protein